MRELYYNDYSLENAPKRNGAVALVKRLQAAGIPIYAVGSQSHDKMDWPSVAQVDSTIRALSGAGVKVNITELDVDVLPPATRNQSADVATRGQRVGGREPVRGRAPRLGAARARRAVRRPVSRFLHRIGTSSTALPSGASAMATRGSTIGPSPDGPAIRCCSTAAIARSRRSTR